MSKQIIKGIVGLEAFDEETKDLNVIIETPKGSRNKYTFDEEKELFKLGGVLSLGMTFPFDFGFIPKTLGDDGDPLDVLILMDEPAFTGCLVPARVIGVIEAQQTEDGKTVRNDRLIAVASNSRTQTDIKSLSDLNQAVVDQIEHFFVSYNEAKGKQFVPLKRLAAAQAKRLIAEGVRKREKNLNK